MNNKLTKETHMTNNLPNLSTWNRVPIGATIPAGTPYAYHYKEEDFFAVKLSGHLKEISALDGEPTYYTEKPIIPPLPREEGATILASSDSDCPPFVVLTRNGERWITPYDSTWYDDQILAWAPITIGETVVMP